MTYSFLVRMQNFGENERTLYAEQLNNKDMKVGCIQVDHICEQITSVPPPTSVRKILNLGRPSQGLGCWVVVSLDIMIHECPGGGLCSHISSLWNIPESVFIRLLN